MSASLNQVILMGNLARDPDLRTTPTGKAVVRLVLAVDRPYAEAQQQTVDFIPVVAWNALATTCAQHLKKGRLVAVTGRWSVRTYQTDGVSHTVHECLADDVRFVDRPA